MISYHIFKIIDIDYKIIINYRILNLYFSDRLLPID